MARSAVPEDVSAAAFPETPIPSEPGPGADQSKMPVAYSTWDDLLPALVLRRDPSGGDGDSHGLLQPASSGAHFFGSVVALPYKMTVRPPHRGNAPMALAVLAIVPRRARQARTAGRRRLGRGSHHRGHRCGFAVVERRRRQSTGNRHWLNV